jgi:hypothetical protein
VSAQILRALRLRADALEREAGNPATLYMIDKDGTVVRDPSSLRWLAVEFRKLADIAEAGE